jgi:TPR repeat protein
LERAAKGSHSAALYSLAIIQFNGSAHVDGGSSDQRDLNCAASLCVKSAKLGNLDAMREVGYCLQNGVGLPPSPTAAYQLLHKANYTRKLNAITNSPNPLISPRRRSKDISLLTNYGYMGREVHAANMFMVEWWWLGDKGEDGLHMCSNVVCGRRETRKNGFRRCSCCGTTIYCSHACQEMHWKMEHGSACVPVLQNV